MRDVAEAIAFAQEALEPSTRDTYMSHIRVYNSWASTAGLPSLGPATSHTDIARYLKYRSDTGTAAESFKSIRSGLAFAFRYLRTNPVEHQLVSDAVVSGRKKGRPSVSRQPLSRAHLLAMSAICHLQKLSAVRDFFAILLAWRGFLRASEVRALDAEDVELSILPAPERKGPLAPLPSLLAPPASPPTPREILVIYISSSKTNPQGQRPKDERRGETVIVGPDADASVCPVTWFKRYSALRTKDRGGLDADKPLFYSTASAKGALAKGAFNEIVKLWLTRIDVDPARFGGHSARAGGATEAARKAVDVRLINDTAVGRVTRSIFTPTTTSRRCSRFPRRWEVSP